MRLPTAVADANSVIGLAKGGVFDRLSQIFSPFYVPPRVTEEVIVKGQGRPGAGELATALGAWVTEMAPDVSMVQQFSPALSVADREVLAVAQAKAVDFILTDDRELRREASRHQLDCLLVAEVLALLKDRGLVTNIKPVLDRMLQENHGIDPAIYEQVLRSAGEWPPP